MLGRDFDIFSTLEDARASKNPWKYCNYNDNGIGFPRDCGPLGSVGGQWNSQERGGQADIEFAVLLPRSLDVVYSINGAECDEPADYDAPPDVRVGLDADDIPGPERTRERRLLDEASGTVFSKQGKGSMCASDFAPAFPDKFFWSSGKCNKYKTEYSAYDTHDYAGDWTRLNPDFIPAAMPQVVEWVVLQPRPQLPARARRAGSADATDEEVGEAGAGGGAAGVLCVEWACIGAAPCPTQYCRRLEQTKRSSMLLVEETRPAKGTLLGTVSFGEDYHLKFDVRPNGTIGSWGSLLHFTTGSNCCEYGSRVPAMWFRAGSSVLMIQVSDEETGQVTMDTPPLAMNEWSALEISVIGNSASVSVNGEVVVSKFVGDRSPLDDVKIYLGDPWHNSAIADVRNIEHSAVLFKTWIRGEDGTRDEGCLAWKCHDPLEENCVPSSAYTGGSGSTDGTIELSGSNNDNAVNLQRCTGECDADSQCAAGLQCFQRSHGGEIPGCTGNGNGNDWDYCYDPSHTSNKNIDAVDDPLPEARCVMHKVSRTCEVYFGQATSVDECQAHCVAAGDGCKAFYFQASNDPKVPGSDPAEEGPKCQLYTSDAGGSEVKAVARVPGTVTIARPDGKAPPLDGECYLRKLATDADRHQQSCADHDAARPSSLNICEPLVPQLDKFGGVSYNNFDAVGEMWDNRDRLDFIDFGPGRNGPNSFDWEGWTIPLVTHHDYIIDWDWHVNYEQFSLNYAVPFLLQDPDVTPMGGSSNVPADAVFEGNAGVQSTLPLPDESVMLSFPYTDARYRVKVDTPARADVPWFDKQYDYCSRSSCQLFEEPERTRGHLTRFDQFGTGFIDRRDDSGREVFGEWKVAINPFSASKDCTKPVATEFSLSVESRVCGPHECLMPPPFDPSGLGKEMLWSAVETWEEIGFADKTRSYVSETGELPAYMEDVEIPEGFHVIMDVDPPLLNEVNVVGRLEIRDLDQDRELKVKIMSVFGEFLIGEDDKPFDNKATIKVYGNMTSTPLKVGDQHPQLLSKAIANFGFIHFNGWSPAKTHVKLRTTANPGDTVIQVMDAVQDWRAGDQITLSATDGWSPRKRSGVKITGSYSGNDFYDFVGPDEMETSSEDVFITSVSADGLFVSLDRELTYRHYAGEVDVGFDQAGRRLLFEAADNTVSLLTDATAITHGPMPRLPQCNPAQWDVGPLPEPNDCTTRYTRGPDCETKYVANCPYESETNCDRGTGEPVCHRDTNTEFISLCFAQCNDYATALITGSCDEDGPHQYTVQDWGAGDVQYACDACVADRCSADEGKDAAPRGRGRHGRAEDSASWVGANGPSFVEAEYDEGKSSDAPNVCAASHWVCNTCDACCQNFADQLGVTPDADINAELAESHDRTAEDLEDERLSGDNVPGWGGLIASQAGDRIALTLGTPLDACTLTPDKAPSWDPLRRERRAPGVAGGAALADPAMEAILKQHNLYRCMHGLELFTWDEDVAANAQAWADNGLYAHSSNGERVVAGVQLGENLAWGFPSRTGVDSTRAWYDEIAFTSPYGTADAFDDSTDLNEAIGHYTQVVWASSTSLGCGKGRAAVNGNDGDYWVCQYGPAGNFAGQFSSQVNAPVKTMDVCMDEAHAAEDDRTTTTGEPTTTPPPAPPAAVVVLDAQSCNDAEALAARADQLWEQGASGLVIVSDEQHFDIPWKLRTITIGSEAGQQIIAALQSGQDITLRANPVELRASVGHLTRSIAVESVLEGACSEKEHSENVMSRDDNCEARDLPHWLCKEEGFVPHDCYWMKGYGAHVMTGQLDYGSVDEYQDHIAAGREPPPSLVGQIQVNGVEFVNLGKAKMAVEHRGFTINYFGDHSKEEVDNKIERCVFRNSWQDAIVIARSPAVDITDNVIHRTLGVGISTGDRFLNYIDRSVGSDFGKDSNFGGRDRGRDRRTMGIVGRGVVPPGGGHMVERNFVSESYETVSSMTYSWHSGAALRHSMASMKDNVVAGAAHAGYSFVLQDAANTQPGNHTITNNEAYSAKYGMYARNSKAHQELYKFKVWLNRRAGLVDVDETHDTTLRGGVFSDNLYGAVFSFLSSAVQRVSGSIVIGTSSAAPRSQQCTAKIGLVLPRWGMRNRLDDKYWSPVKECAMEGNKMDGRFFKTTTGRMENWYISDTTFAHFGSDKCKETVGIAINPLEVDYSPETWLSQLNWRPTVAQNRRFRLGDVSMAEPQCAKSCDAVNYMRAHDQDGTTLECFWNDGSPDNHRGTIMFSDRNPAITVERQCKADSQTESIVCRNYDPKMVAANIMPPCNECLPPDFINVHKYGVQGLNGVEEARRSYWSVGSFEESCGCAKHNLEASFPAQRDHVYDVDLPVNVDLQGDTGELHPEWMTPNSDFTLFSNDPTYCVLFRMWWHARNGDVTLVMNGESMDHMTLTDGSYPTYMDESGTNVLDPQEQRLHVSLCGSLSGSTNIALRIKETVQVSMEVEMTMAEFFQETLVEVEVGHGGIGLGGDWDITPHDPQHVTVKDDRLFSRTVALERMVTGFTTLLSIPRNKVKVVCVHEVGEPCIPGILDELLNGFNPTRRSGRGNIRASAAAERLRRAGGNVQVKFDIIPPNPVNTTGDAVKYTENLAWLDDIVEQLEVITTSETFEETFSAITGLTEFSGVAIAQAYGLSAGDPEVVAIVGDVQGVAVGVQSKQPDFVYIPSPPPPSAAEEDDTPDEGDDTPDQGDATPDEGDDTPVVTNPGGGGVETAGDMLQAVKLILLYLGHPVIQLTTAELIEISESVSQFVLNSTGAVTVQHLQSVLVNSGTTRHKRDSVILSIEFTQVFTYRVDAATSATVASDINAAIGDGNNTIYALGQDIVVASAAAKTVTLLEASVSLVGIEQTNAALLAESADRLSTGAVVGIAFSTLLLVAAIGFAVHISQKKAAVG